MNEDNPTGAEAVHASPQRESGFQLSAPRPLEGSEELAGTGFEVRRFWSWAFSDLASNVTRSILAEFLVARALGDPRPAREEWADFDVLTADGVRVEVKSAAYLQTWRQWKLSLIRFGGFTGRSWDADTGAIAEGRTIRADVFVFAVQACSDVDDYDRLDVRQWEFYVVPATAVAAYGHRSANLAWVRRTAGAPVAFDGLDVAVRRVVSLARSAAPDAL